MTRKVLLWVDGPRNQIDDFVIWLHSQSCSIVNIDEKLGAFNLKTIELDLELHFKPEEEVLDNHTKL